MSSWVKRGIGMVLVVIVCIVNASPGVSSAADVSLRCQAIPPRSLSQHLISASPQIFRRTSLTFGGLVAGAVAMSQAEAVRQMPFVDSPSPITTDVWTDFAISKLLPSLFGGLATLTVIYEIARRQTVPTFFGNEQESDIVFGRIVSAAGILSLEPFEQIKVVEALTTPSRGLGQAVLKPLASKSDTVYRRALPVYRQYLEAAIAKNPAVITIAELTDQTLSGKNSVSERLANYFSWREVSLVNGSLRATSLLSALHYLYGFSGVASRGNELHFLPASLSYVKVRRGKIDLYFRETQTALLRLSRMDSVRWEPEKVESGPPEGEGVAELSRIMPLFFAGGPSLPHWLFFGRALTSEDYVAGHPLKTAA